MSIRRAAFYIGGASLLGAWLSSVASLTFQPHPAPAARPAAHDAGSPDGVAGDVQAQARRLKERLASAPPPQQPLRNPFEFHVVRARPQASSLPRGEFPFEPAAIGPQEPNFTLVGVAVHQQPGGALRTAIIATEDDTPIMAVVGDVVLQRYTVTAIGADSVDLTDAETGRSRRLSLHPH